MLTLRADCVDVITDLIKANIPSRISFRVATRGLAHGVGRDGRGAPAGQGRHAVPAAGVSRLTRVHGAFVTETEINRVVDFWKAQAKPEYGQSFLIAPPSDE